LHGSSLRQGLLRHSDRTTEDPTSDLLCEWIHERGLLHGLLRSEPKRLRRILPVLQKGAPIIPQSRPRQNQTHEQLESGRRGRTARRRNSGLCETGPAGRFHASQNWKKSEQVPSARRDDFGRPSKHGAGYGGCLPPVNRGP
jgi:hypothetical protein